MAEELALAIIPAPKTPPAVMLEPRYERESVLVSDVNDRERIRKDYGAEEMAELQESIIENGIIQFIGLNQDNKLIWGGRRFEAMKRLGFTNLIEHVHFVRRVTTSESNLKILELEENLKRKDMSWTERVLGIAETHRLHKRDASLQSLKWGQRETARELGLKSHSTVQYALTIADAIEAGNVAVIEAPSMMGALSVLLRQQEDLAMKRLEELKAHNRPRPVIVEETIGAPNDPIYFEEDDASSPAIEHNIDDDFLTDLIDPDITDDQPQTSGSIIDQELSVPLLEISITKTILHVDCIIGMRSLADESIDHIISDPPYGRDMANIKGMIVDGKHQGGIKEGERLDPEHDVLSNVELFRLMWPHFARILRPEGWCILWIGLEHFALHKELAEASGFSVQPWPNVWVKSYSPSNKMAHKNFTCATEWAILARRSTKTTLVSPQAHNWYMATREPTVSNKFAKPLPIWGWLAKAVAIYGQTILDPFAGEGSSAKAFISAGYRIIMMEKSDLHYPYLVENVETTYKNILRNQVKFT